MDDLEGKINELKRLIEGANKQSFEDITSLTDKVTALEETVDRFDPEKVLFIDELKDSEPFKQLVMYCKRFSTSYFGSNRINESKIEANESKISALQEEIS